MNFFAQQDQARKRTGQLVVLFIVAMILLILAANALIVAAAWGFSAYSVEHISDAPSFVDLIIPEQWAVVTLGVILVVSLASTYRWFTLKSGGQSVAQLLGGRQIPLNTDDFYEKRVLNVVEEMALASGMPVPPVYVMEDQSINAFAAGHQPSDAVIGVTQGCMRTLSRDQLQGVMAHEFSHILNGDMRLNIRLMSVLFGILFIGLIGRMLLDTALYSPRRSEKDNRAPLWAAGIGLMVIGYTGVLVGNLIKAAVSRQREFLADASAVQFTRDPSTIAGALKVIGHGAGSEIKSPEREETAHMFFGQAMPFLFSAFATHPPLEERILRIDPQWDGQFLAPTPQAHATSAKQGKEDGKNDDDQRQKLAKVMAAGAIVGELAQAGQNEVPIRHAASPLLEAASDPYSAQALIFSLLLSDDETLRHQQINVIDNTLAVEVERLFALREHIESHERLQLAERAIASLKALSKGQWKTFSHTLIALIESDGYIDLFEWCLFRLTQQYVGASFGAVKPSRFDYAKPKQVAKEIAVVLSYLAYYGHDNEADAKRAFDLACKQGKLGDLSLALAPRDDVDSLNPLNSALATLANAYPAVKEQLINALVACAQSDGEMRPIERDLITTLAAILETPVVV